MTKKDLLKTVEETELNRVNNLTRKELETEFYDWFSESDTLEDVKEATTHSLVAEYMESFMTYKNDYSLEELQEFTTLEDQDDENLKNLLAILTN